MKVCTVWEKKLFVIRSRFGKRNCSNVDCLFPLSRNLSVRNGGSHVARRVSVKGVEVSF